MPFDIDKMFGYVFTYFMSCNLQMPQKINSENICSTIYFYKYQIR